MKNFVRLILFSFVFVLPASLFSQQAQFRKGAEYCSYRKSTSGAKFLMDIQSANTPKHKFDVIKYTLNLNLYSNYSSPYPKTFKGTNIVRFIVDSALNSIQLNANNTSLAIDSVRLSGVSFTHSNNILTINLNRTYNPGEVAEVKIIYRHLNVSDSGLYVSNGFLFTDCEPQGARKWLPCWDQPSDKALLDLTAKVPATVKLGSNGHLQDSTHLVDTIWYHWVTRDPLSTYLMVITSKVNYNLHVKQWPLFSNPSVQIPLRFYFNAGEDPTPIESIINDVATYFSSKFGDMAFEKNGFATLNNQFIWGGMENQTLTSICPNCWYESVCVHEFAHQWFGDMVTCGTWADIFINEAFATYLEAIYLEHTSGYTSYKSDIDQDASSYLSGNPGWAIYDSTWAITPPSLNTLFNTPITYYKGACVLHQLRYVMGDSLFFAGMHSYATDTTDFRYKNALITDFRDKMAQTYGQSLQWYFDEWTKHPNHPVYQNTYYIMNMGGGVWRVVFNAKQIQTNTVFFKMPVELRISFTSYPDTTIRVMNDVNNQQFFFDFNHQPTQLAFDPDNMIVLKQATTVVGIENLDYIPAGMSLSQNMPNPFSGSCDIFYEVPANTMVKLSVFDMPGNKIRDLVREYKPAGVYQVHLSSENMKPGIYFYRMEAAGMSLTKKMVIIK